MSLIKVYREWFQERENPYRFWIPISKKAQDEQFNSIVPYTRYVLKLSFAIMTKKIDWKQFILSNPKAFVTLIILLDQYYRTLAKVFTGFNKFKRIITYLTYDSVNSNINTIIGNKPLTGKECIFLMMPFKHMLAYKIVSPVHPYTLNQMLNCHLYKRFYTDFIEKYYNRIDVVPSSESFFKSFKEDYYSVCEHCDMDFFDLPYCEAHYSNDLFYIDNVIEKFVIDNNLKKICVSLSGGIDSMVMLFSLLKLNNKKRINIELQAFHLLYNNREESHLEFQMISEYCACLGIKLYYYHIEYLKRATSLREPYEKITRDIRFKCYRYFEGFNVCLGHIYDDYVENIITNFATNKHIDNLGKFKAIEKQEGVLVTRPFLKVKKEKIYEYAEEYNIPHLLNTTPKWCNRGKFRNRFVNDLTEQYGEEVFENMIRSSEKVNSMNRIIENMVIKPVVQTFIQHDEFFVTREMLEEPYILKRIFEGYMHNKKIGRPSDKSIENLVKSIPGNRKIEIKKNLCFRISGNTVRLVM